MSNKKGQCQHPSLTVGVKGDLFLVREKTVVGIGYIYGVNVDHQSLPKFNWAPCA